MPAAESTKHAQEPQTFAEPWLQTSGGEVMLEQPLDTALNWGSDLGCPMGAPVSPGVQFLPAWLAFTGGWIPKMQTVPGGHWAARSWCQQFGKACGKGRRHLGSCECYKGKKRKGRGGGGSRSE